MRALKLKKTQQENLPPYADDDDFQSLPLTQTASIHKHSSTTKTTNPTHITHSSDSSSLEPLKPSNCSLNRPSKKPKPHPGKENELSSQGPLPDSGDLGMGFDCCLDSIESTIDSASVPAKKTATSAGILDLKPKGGISLSSNSIESKLLKSNLNCPSSVCKHVEDKVELDTDTNMTASSLDKLGLKPKGIFNYSSNSIESRLLRSNMNCGPSVCEGDGDGDDDIFQPGSTQLDVLLKLCSEADEQYNHIETSGFGGSGLIHCPMCGLDIADLSNEQKQVHTNECLDKVEAQTEAGSPDNDPGLERPGQVLNSSPSRAPGQAVDVSPVLEWLRSLGLARYEDVFIREEIDWDSLQWLTEEDLCSIGVTALGPRKKIIHAVSELRKEGSNTVEANTEASMAVDSDTSKLAATKLITDYFPGSVAANRKASKTSRGQNEIGKINSKDGCKRVVVKKQASNKKLRDIPLWCCIPETPFRVDAFKYLRRDCFHWFLTHFHTDHYQGLTKSFCHGKIYCSLITAKLVNLKIGIPWDKLEILPLNQKISISGINVTCFDANHCPGSIIILFEPPSGKAVLHTGDFRFSEEMAKNYAFQTCPIHTLILDTTYCDPQYEFPKQDAVIQFVIEAIQAESFNPKTLFLIGSYTIGKERLFLEVARVLRKKIYVPAGKLRLLESLGISDEDMHWFTLNELESHIHVVPMWTLASFKRLKHISNQYTNRFSLIVAFSPTGWTFGKGKKSSPGRRWQQGTIIRYEVPYSEHCSFTELREFVKFISPMNIVPSVNNHGPESANSMVSLLLS